MPSKPSSSMFSVKNRVMASVTSMLVLESDADYDRYQIPRTASADILSVGNGGVEWLKRKAPVMQIAKVAPVQKTAGYPHDHDKAKKMADTRSANAATKDGEDADDSDGKFDRADSGVAVAGKAEEEKEVCGHLAGCTPDRRNHTARAQRITQQSASWRRSGVVFHQMWLPLAHQLAALLHLRHQNHHRRR